MVERDSIETAMRAEEMPVQTLVNKLDAIVKGSVIPKVSPTS